MMKTYSNVKSGLHLTESDACKSVAGYTFDRDHGARRMMAASKRALAHHLTEDDAGKTDANVRFNGRRCAAKRQSTSDLAEADLHHPDRLLQQVIQQGTEPYTCLL